MQENKIKYFKPEGFKGRGVGNKSYKKNEEWHNKTIFHKRRKRKVRFSQNLDIFKLKKFQNPQQSNFYRFKLKF